VKAALDAAEAVTRRPRGRPRKARPNRWIDGSPERSRSERDRGSQSREPAGSRRGCPSRGSDQRSLQQICDDALKRIKTREGLPDVPALVERLDAAYEMAMVTRQPNAAVNAIMAQGRLLGLIIDRQISKNGLKHEK
jgi:hypothetical protein